VSSTDKDNNLKPMPNSPRYRTRAKHVSEFAVSILQDVIGRRTGMTMDLIAGWEDIVGEDYANCTMPEKIIWPKRSSDADPFKPGVLIVACDGAKALFFQHETGQILERLNLFFGFMAIEKIKLVQKPVAKKTLPRQLPKNLSEREKQRLGEVLSKIDDPKLRQKLEKFGRGVILKNQSAK
jgi:hypothetical protein